jgi:hypothetical protein
MGSVGIGRSVEQTPAVQGTAGEALAAGGSASGFVPPHLRETTNSTTQDPSLSSITDPYETRTDFTGEKGRNGTASSAELHSAGGENVNTQTSTTREGWSAADGKRREPVIAFNAWDSAGQVHTRYRLPSTTTGISNTVLNDSSARSVASAARPVAAGARPLAPATGPAASASRPVTSRRDNVWAKPVSDEITRICRGIVQITDMLNRQLPAFLQHRSQQFVVLSDKPSMMMKTARMRCEHAFVEL